MSITVSTSSRGIGGELGKSPVVGALLDQLPLGVVVASRDGQEEYVNPLAVALFAEDHRSDEGRVLSKTAAVEALRWIMGRVLLTGEVIRDEEVQYFDTQDERRTLSVSATPVEQNAVGPAHVVLTFQDVTERNRGRDWEPLVRSLSRL